MPRIKHARKKISSSQPALKALSRRKSFFVYFLIFCITVLSSIFVMKVFSHSDTSEQLNNNSAINAGSVNANARTAENQNISTQNANVAEISANVNSDLNSNINASTEVNFSLDSNSIYYYNNEHQFSLLFPLSWKSHLTASREFDWGEIGSSKTLDFGFDEQPALFSLFFLSHDQWIALSNQPENDAVFLGETKDAVIARKIALEATSDAMQERLNDVDAIFSSFQIFSGSSQDVQSTQQNDSQAEYANTFDNERISFLYPKVWHLGNASSDSMARVVLSPYETHAGEYNVNSDIYIDMHHSLQGMLDYREGEVFEDYISRYASIDKTNLIAISLEGCRAYQLNRNDGIVWKEAYFQCGDPVYAIRIQEGSSSDDIFRSLVDSFRISK